MVKVISYGRHQGKTNRVGKLASAKPNNNPLSRTTRSRLGKKTKRFPEVELEATLRVPETALERQKRELRNDALQTMLLGKRQEILREIQDNVGQALTEGQQRRLESVGDIADQALRTFERDRSIFVIEMRNRKRQSLDEALNRLREGTYGICAECGIDINEKRLQAVPFAKLCVMCQARTELLDRINQTEDREDP